MNAQPIGLVTGASGGIGQAIARELAPKYRLVLVASNTDKLGQLAAQLAGAETIALDLSTPFATRQFNRELETRHLDISVLIDNAGFADSGESWLTPKN